MTPSERINRMIDDLANDAESYYCRHDEIVERVYKIIDEAVREAVLITYAATRG